MTGLMILAYAFVIFAFTFFVGFGLTTLYFAGRDAGRRDEEHNRDIGALWNAIGDVQNIREENDG